MSKRILSLLLVLVMVVLALASCKPTPTPGPDNGDNNTGDNIVIKEGDFTYKSWSTSLGTNWNPHTWEMSGDSAIMGYIESPLVDLSALNTEEGTYQWVYEMATSITDVTAANQADLTKYGSTLPDGKTAADIVDSYVYEIKLNPNAKWENGDVINADTYIYSMQMLLDSRMRNYRANNYISGTSALAGAMGYYNSEALLFDAAPWMGGEYPSEYVVEEDGTLSVTVNDVKYPLYFSVTQVVPFFGSNSAKDYYDAGYTAYFTAPYTGEVADPENLPDYVFNAGTDEEPVYMIDAYQALAEMENAYRVLPATEESLALIAAIAANFGDPNPLAWNEFVYVVTGVGEKVEWDTVGLYKVDDYTIRYVCQTAYEYNYFLTSCTSNWIVHQATYEANMKTEAGMLVTTYGTSKATTMSYGPYKMESFEDDKQVIFVQNPNWYGYQKTENGYLYSITNFEVDGKKHQQYQTTKLVIDVLTQDAAYSRFLAGELTDYAPTPEELQDYNLSDRLYRVDETYTMRWFFNTNTAKLQALDAGSNNDNSVVLSNYNFRKAMSLAINRADFVTVTEGWKPAYALMNSLYFYDIYNDPTSSYRNSEEAMQAICNLYGVQYGEDKIYKTLEEAYKSINGYNLTEAKALMKTACEELVAAGLYVAGENIKIQIGWAKGALTAADNAQLAKMNEYLNAALEGSGFGTLEFEAIGGISNRYADVAAGKYAIGWGAWGGAAFYPFGMMQVYMDPDYADIHEAGCWNPATETLELTFTNTEGETVTDTLTWQIWSQSLEGTGKYANESNEVKLAILALLEEKYLNLYYCIPMAGTTICSLLSYQVDEYTQDYNIMYSFGGFRLMSWNYTDAEWTTYVASQGGKLNYK